MSLGGKLYIDYGLYVGGIQVEPWYNYYNKDLEGSLGVVYIYISLYRSRILEERGSYMAEEMLFH